VKPRFFKSSAELREWLERHHARASELQVGFYKKTSSRTGVGYKEALDEALCFGWIDGVRRAVDDERYTIRFTARRPGSVWSVVNTKRAQELIEQGLMRPAGRAAFESRDVEKTKRYSYERETSNLDREYQRRFESNRKAWAFFGSRPPGYRKLAIHWVMSAKREETRERRLAELIDCSARGEKPRPFLVSRASRRK
jgi:uncharacterized protein YdeI (YjbR/CyaY-like superfamily)